MEDSPDDYYKEKLVKGEPNSAELKVYKILAE